eukprot:CAMPEP_0181060032 /NCGR_PEP_ID=MMETSP1070-20121207/21730_1 /TAXON_ID=265543 /ORGANISM="Minutocellus polymorphus, Strain NH13" /LENGTH=36 /DNA_ID= /DNA_START= /DNA_END= /DNA_ORIENTATION=
MRRPTRRRAGFFLAMRILNTCIGSSSTALAHAQDAS